MRHPFAITPLLRADWPAVCAIYEAGLATGQASFEVAVPTWEIWSQRHLESPRLVARTGDEIVGWAALSPVSPRPVYKGVAEVSVYVDPTRTGEGIGSLLLGALVDCGEAEGIWTLQASIFRENQASVSLHLRQGFREVGIRRRIAQQHGVWRDTVIFERRSEVVGGG